jgi:UDP-N-acetylmuramoyl-L-alanyl-D-glutamate--2,6-diaminopimelate ligase
MKDLEIIGVTGTDGKTTTTLLIYHILKIAKKKVAVVSTVEAKIGRKAIKTGFHVTSPDPWKLQKLLRQIRSKKYRYVVLEVTSHGLDQFRLYPVRPKIAVLTNITHEHLDYHKTFDDYRRAKLKLFKHAEHAVVNKDLPIFQRINAELPKIMLSTYSVKSDSQLKPSNVKFFKDKTKFRVGNMEYEVPLTGEYNLYNALAAISTALILDISPSDIKRALMSFPGVRGRLDEIPNKLGIHAYVDFAHTPNALASVLQNLHAQKKPGEKLTVVFGAAGLRDRSKRPLMGTAAAEYADNIIITSEDPRTEDAHVIADNIMSGIPKNKMINVAVELNREKAIFRAIEMAERGDWVVCCGKGHEESMNYDGFNELPWSEHDVVSRALKFKAASVAEKNDGIRKSRRSK